MAFIFCILCSELFRNETIIIVQGGMMLILDTDAYNSFRVTFKPNSALTPAGKQKVVALLTIIPCLVGLGFAVIGAWLILPFVGLEIVALGYAFYYINKIGRAHV